MNEKKRDLLVNLYFPVDEVSEESIVEKNGRPPIFEMHYWWTRKPLITARASILASSFTSDIEKNFLKTILGLDKTFKMRKERSYNKSPSIYLELLRSEFMNLFGTETPTLLDPFAGGGSIPFEALRLGFNVIASDYNPVSWLILKATLEYPRKFGKKLLEIIKKAYSELYYQLKDELNSLYPYDGYRIPSAYIYAWTITCPYCSFEAPLTNNWQLSRKKVKSSNKTEWIYLNPQIKNKKLTIEILEEKAEIPSLLKEGTNTRGKGICLNCKNTIENSYIVKEINEKEKEYLMAKVLVEKEKHGKKYCIPNQNDIKALEQAKDLLRKSKNISLPNLEMEKKVIRSARYLETWDRLYNPRQKLFFAKFIQKSLILCEKYSNELGDEWGEVLSIYFSILLGKMINYNCRITSWHNTRDGIVHALTFRTFPIIWDHCEVNPFAPKGSGTMNVMIKNVLDGVEFASKSLANVNGNIIVLNKSAIDSGKDSVDLIVTDPPYGDDVPYSEVSDFFYSWQQLILKEYFPHLPSGSVPSSEDLSDNKKDRNMDFVQIGLQSSFKNLHSRLNDSGYFTLFFAHSSLDTWSFVINALRTAGFQIFATYPIHTENPNNPITRGKASFFTSILMFCRKREGEQLAYLEELEDEMEQKVRSRIRSFLSSGLRGADLSMAALGPALEVLTSYSDLKTISGSLDVADVLALTNKPVIEETLGQFLDNVGNLDSLTQLYLFARVNGMTKIPFDTLQILSKSLNIDLSLSTDLLIEKQSGNHKLFSFNSYNSRDIQLSQFSPLIDYLHFAFQQFEQKGESAFWSVFADGGYSRQAILNLLSLIASGLSYSTDRVAGEQDFDAKLTKSILSLSTNYKPLKRFRGTQRTTTLDEFSNNDS